VVSGSKESRDMTDQEIVRHYWAPIVSNVLRRVGGFERLEILDGRTMRITVKEAIRKEAAMLVAAWVELEFDGISVDVKVLGDGSQVASEPAPDDGPIVWSP
jgi:hypothetical protein